ncbi:MAG: hypothetical protein ACOYYJ_00600 [Chloroflexota bacterium]
MFKRDLAFHPPLMNAAGTLGFAPDFRAPVPWETFGAFVTNPISLRPRLPAASPALVEYPGGFLLHTGLPNPGLPAAIQKYARRWADARLPVIVHLMADRPEETRRMAQALEELENIAALELGFAPGLSDDLILLTIEICLGELPLIACLPVEQVLSLGPRAVQAGAAAISLAAPRGMIPLPPASPHFRFTSGNVSRTLESENGGNKREVTGRLSGAGLFPQALLAVRDAVRANLTVIGAGGVQSKGNAEAMLLAGATAVQVDESLWKGTFSAAVRAA